MRFTEDEKNWIISGLNQIADDISRGDEHCIGLDENSLTHEERVELVERVMDLVGKIQKEEKPPPKEFYRIYYGDSET